MWIVNEKKRKKKIKKKMMKRWKALERIVRRMGEMKRGWWRKMVGFGRRRRENVRKT